MKEIDTEQPVFYREHIDEKLKRAAEDVEGGRDLKRMMNLRCMSCGSQEFIVFYEDGILAAGCSPCGRIVLQIAVASLPSGSDNNGEVQWNWQVG